MPLAKPLTSSHRKNDSRWSEILSTSVIKGRQFVTGGVDEYSTLPVDVASDLGSLHGPSTSPPTPNNLPTVGNLVTAFADHDQHNSPTRSPVPPVLDPEEFRHLTVSTSQRSSYSELAANLAYLSEANGNSTRSVNGESMGSALHAPCNSSDITPLLPPYFDGNNPNDVALPLAYDNATARSCRSTPRKNADTKARRHSSQTSEGKRAGRSRERGSKTEVRACTSWNRQYQCSFFYPSQYVKKSKNARASLGTASSVASA